MTYLEREYPSRDAARTASALLDELGITGEWYLRKTHGDAWRLSIAAEDAVRDDTLARLGGKAVDDTAADASEADDE